MDKELFYKLFDQQRNKLYRFANRILNDSGQAEDVVQESFIRLWNSSDDWKDYRNPGGPYGNHLQESFPGQAEV